MQTDIVCHTSCNCINWIISSSIVSAAYRFYTEAKPLHAEVMRYKQMGVFTFGCCSVHLVFAQDVHSVIQRVPQAGRPCFGQFDTTQRTCF